MSSPNDMKTGKQLGGIPENIFPETFFIIYLILLAILRRMGFKDSSLYSYHNNKPCTQEMFDSGILFNLHSEYGVGKSLMPLIIELFRTVGIDPYANKDNIFYKEIIRLTTKVSRIIRSHDPEKETQWMIDYAVLMEYVKDDILKERENRLKTLLPKEEKTPNWCFSMEISSSDTELTSDTENTESIESNASDTISSDISSNSDTTTSDDIFSSSDTTSGMDISDTNTTSSDDIFSDSDNTTSIDISNINLPKTNVLCSCLFCKEFQKYHKPYVGRNVVNIINEVLTNISTSMK